MFFHFLIEPLKVICNYCRQKSHGEEISLKRASFERSSLKRAGNVFIKAYHILIWDWMLIFYL